MVRRLSIRVSADEHARSLTNCDSIKGVSTTQGTRCAMCRQSFPSRLIIQPSIIEDYNEDDNEVWFYEGRNGWWQYDQRTNEHIGKSSFTKTLLSHS